MSIVSRGSREWWPARGTVFVRVWRADRTERPREGGAKTRLEKRIRHAQESDPTSVQCAVRKEDLGCDWGH